MEDATWEEILQRLLASTGSPTEAVLADRLGISSQSIYNAKKKGKIPPAWVVDVSKKYDVSTDWLFFGLGAMRRSDSGPSEERDRAPQEGARDLLMVPRVKARLSAGSGSLETSDDIEERYAFKSKWLRSKGQASKMVLMYVTGDSMEPDIKDRDMVLIDQSQVDIVAGGAYAIGMDDEVLVKYVDKEPGTYVLRSANPLYASIKVDLRDESLNVRVIGRVLWVGREV